MTPTRYRELRASLEDRLAKEFPSATSSPTDRVRWLGLQLENYLERWLGFAALPDASLPSLVAGTLYGAVAIGAAVFDREITRLPEPKSPELLPAWNRLRTAIAHIPTAGSMPDLEALRALLRQFMAALPASEFHPNSEGRLMKSQFRGGARIDGLNGTWPFATLVIGDATLMLTLFGIGHVYQKSEIIGITRQDTLFSGGVRIELARAILIFWSFRPQKVLHAAFKHGYPVR